MHSIAKPVSLGPSRKQQNKPPKMPLSPKKTTFCFSVLGFFFFWMVTFISWEEIQYRGGECKSTKAAKEETRTEFLFLGFCLLHNSKGPKGVKALDPFFYEKKTRIAKVIAWQTSAENSDISLFRPHFCSEPNQKFWPRSRISERNAHGRCSFWPTGWNKLKLINYGITFKRCKRWTILCKGPSKNGWWLRPTNRSHDLITTIYEQFSLRKCLRINLWPGAQRTKW